MPATDAFMVSDMAGVPVFLRQPVQKGMVFAPVADHFITVDNSDAHLMALAAYIKAEAAQTMLGKIFPTLPHKREALTVEVTQPLGVEQTLLLNPDTVLLYEHQAAPFEAAGFAGLARITSIRDQEREMFAMLGGLTKQTQRVGDLFARQDALLMKLFGSVPANRPPVTTLILSHENFYLFPTLFENFNANLKRCNAVNLAENAVSPSGVMNLEALLKFNPEVLFLYDYRNRLTVQDIYSHRALAGLAAVQNGRVYRMPKGVARMTGPVEEPLLFYWISRLLHPEAVEIPPLRQLIKDTYFEVFGYRPTEADVDDFLNMRENASSTGYTKFAQTCGNYEK